MRPIDADALKASLEITGTAESCKGCKHESREWSCCADDIPTNYVCEQIDEAPTIDAVPVIRCKDCTHWDGYYCHNEWWGDGYGNYTPPIKKEDGFCDWAE